MGIFTLPLLGLYWHIQSSYDTFHKLALSQLLVCSPAICSKFEDPHFPLAAFTLCRHCWVLQTLHTDFFPDNVIAMFLFQQVTMLKNLNKYK